MKTDVIKVSGQGSQMENALLEAEKAAAYKGLSRKNALHLRLLTEEMMGMMRSITGETEGKFWIETEGSTFRLHLLVVTNMTSGKRGQLLNASSSGKNESAKGLMGRLRDFFDRGADEDVAMSVSPLLMPGMFESSSTPALDWEWSMLQYESMLQTRVEQDDAEAKEAWDELEKSVVARVADEVRVAIKGSTVEMTLIKTME